MEADEEAFKLHPIGTGPYKFVEWKQGDSVTLERFDDYYAGPAETQKLVMKVIPEASQRTIAWRQEKWTWLTTCFQTTWRR